ncbi:somatostatin 1.2 [Megalops cyprinoides]|uniref:somatostatin 1.2 n=1 Tax=Megalops cyprinoides TaxID=118141 RepID=UPI001864D94A|nr:somatostatin 1.2 [Megalops cyprinoides]
MQTLRVSSTLALLGLALTLCSLSAASQPDLRYRRVLQRARAAAMGTQDWSKREVEDLLSQLAPPEGEAVEGQVSTTDESEDVRVELERSVDNPNNLPPRERKAGCKNFYWKGFTSC